MEIQHESEASLAFGGLRVRSSRTNNQSIKSSPCVTRALPETQRMLMEQSGEKVVVRRQEGRRGLPRQEGQGAFPGGLSHLAPTWRQAA